MMLKLKMVRFKDSVGWPQASGTPPESSTFSSEMVSASDAASGKELDIVLDDIQQLVILRFGGCHKAVPLHNVREMEFADVLYNASASAPNKGGA